MNNIETGRRLPQVTSDNYLEGRDGKLTIQLVSTRACISRQVFHRFYSHLNLYVLGRISVRELSSTETREEFGQVEQ